MGKQIDLDEHANGKTILNIYYGCDIIIIRYTDGDYSAIISKSEYYGEPVIDTIDDWDLCKAGIINKDEYEIRKEQMRLRREKEREEYQREQYERLKEKFGK